jgi:hypothetical protein
MIGRLFELRAKEKLNPTAASEACLQYGGKICGRSGSGMKFAL